MTDFALSSAPAAPTSPPASPAPRASAATNPGASDREFTSVLERVSQHAAKAKAAAPTVGKGDPGAGRASGSSKGETGTEASDEEEASAEPAAPVPAGMAPPVDPPPDAPAAPVPSSDGAAATAAPTVAPVPVDPGPVTPGDATAAIVGTNGANGGEALISAPAPIEGRATAATSEPAPAASEPPPAASGAAPVPSEPLRAASEPLSLARPAAPAEPATPDGPIAHPAPTGSDAAASPDQATPEPGTAAPTATAPATTPATGPSVAPLRPELSSVRFVSAPTPPPVDAEPWQQVHHALGSLRHLTDGSDTIRVRLHPELLGEVLVEVTALRGDLRIHLVAETPAARERLNAELGQLASRLAESGLNASSLDVATGGHGTPYDDKDRPRWSSPASRPDHVVDLGPLSATTASSAGSTTAGRIDLIL